MSEKLTDFFQFILKLEWAWTREVSCQCCSLETCQISFHTSWLEISSWVSALPCFLHSSPPHKPNPNSSMTEVEASKIVIISILSKSDLFVYFTYSSDLLNKYLFLHSFSPRRQRGFKTQLKLKLIFFFPTIYEFVKNCANRAPCIVNRLFPYEWWVVDVASQIFIRGLLMWSNKGS